MVRYLPASLVPNLFRPRTGCQMSDNIFTCTELTLASNSFNFWFCNICFSHLNGLMWHPFYNGLQFENICRYFTRDSVNTKHLIFLWDPFKFDVDFPSTSPFTVVEAKSWMLTFASPDFWGVEDKYKKIRWLSCQYNLYFPNILFNIFATSLAGWCILCRAGKKSHKKSMSLVGLLVFIY